MYDFVRARLAVVRGPLGSLPWAQWGHRGLAIHGLDWESVVEGMVHAWPYSMFRNNWFHFFVSVCVAAIRYVGSYVERRKHV